MLFEKKPEYAITILYLRELYDIFLNFLNAGDINKIQ